VGDLALCGGLLLGEEGDEKRVGSRLGGLMDALAFISLLCVTSLLRQRALSPSGDWRRPAGFWQRLHTQ
jgi:hypothetical protein